MDTDNSQNYPFRSGISAELIDGMRFSKFGTISNKIGAFFTILIAIEFGVCFSPFAPIGIMAMSLTTGLALGALTTPFIFNRVFKLLGATAQSTSLRRTLAYTLSSLLMLSVFAGFMITGSLVGSAITAALGLSIAFAPLATLTQIGFSALSVIASALQMPAVASSLASVAALAAGYRFIPWSKIGSGITRIITAQFQSETAPNQPQEIYSKDIQNESVSLNKGQSDRPADPTNGSIELPLIDTKKENVTSINAIVEEFKDVTSANSINAIVEELKKQSRGTMIFFKNNNSAIKKAYSSFIDTNDEDHLSKAQKLLNAVNEDNKATNEQKELAQLLFHKVQEITRQATSRPTAPLSHDSTLTTTFENQTIPKKY
ncbi:MAG: hypothetical protein FJ161_01870 [Gammaproteobacteria bacterium]|nr:hypothetical protein [Gammaproteobacteria bacterium]